MEGRIFFTIVKCYLVTIYLYKFEHYQIHHKHGVTCYVLYLWVNSYEGGENQSTSSKVYAAYAVSSKTNRFDKYKIFEVTFIPKI